MIIREFAEEYLVPEDAERMYKILNALKRDGLRQDRLYENGREFIENIKFGRKRRNWFYHEAEQYAARLLVIYPYYVRPGAFSPAFTATLKLLDQWSYQNGQ